MQGIFFVSEYVTILLAGRYRLESAGDMIMSCQSKADLLPPSIFNGHWRTISEQQGNDCA